MDQIKLPRFKLSDLEKDSMKSVLECLLILRAKFVASGLSLNMCSSPKKLGRDARNKWHLLGNCLKENDSPRGGKVASQLGSPTFSGEERQKDTFDYFQGAKISELMKANNLDSLLGVMNGILEECVEIKSGEIPKRVASLLRKIVREIERRISTQADHLKIQNSFFKTREEKYQSRIKVLEALASGSNEESLVATNQLQQIKNSSFAPINNMGIVSSFMGKGLASTQMLSFAIGTLYDRFMEKDVKNFEDFHMAILDIFNTFNASLPGKHYDAPTRKDIEICFTDWKRAEESEKKRVFVEFMKQNVKLSKLDDTTLVTGLVTPPVAMVAKKAGESVPQLSIIKVVPDVVFVPTATVIALVSVKLSRRIFMHNLSS